MAEANGTPGRLDADRMWVMPAGPARYDCRPEDSLAAHAARAGVTPVEAFIDLCLETEGRCNLNLPFLNQRLDAVEEMLDDPVVTLGLGDAGAHVGTVCDASFSTFMLTHWVRDRAEGRLPLERTVEMLTRRNARYLGLTDRGTIGVGQRADLNVIDPQRLAVGEPLLVRDLPAGGKRFLQKGVGYVGTWVAGQPVQSDGVITAARPGRLVRAGR